VSARATTGVVGPRRLPLGAVRAHAVWVAVALALVAGAVVTPSTVAPDQLAVIARQAAPLGLLALGQAVLMLGRQFDLSVGGVVALVNVVAAGGFAQQHGGLAAAALCLGLGALIGLVNGLGVSLGRVDPFVMTLGMAFVLSGAVLVYTGGAPSGRIPEAIRDLSATRALGLAVSVWIWLAAALLLAGVLARMRIGREVYARGVSPEAARLAGVRTRRVEIGSFVLSGLCAALGGLLLAGFVGTGTLGAGQDLLLQSLAAVVVGGITFAGGRGSVLGSVGGAFLLTLLGALLTGAGLGQAGTLIVGGLVLAGAAALFQTRAGSA
jgi:ribose/xylose/arabinose/galactoside ABC-type transport system permease subunit